MLKILAALPRCKPFPRPFHLLFLALLLGACGAAPPQHRNGTQRMIERLGQLAKAGDPEANHFMNAEQAARLLTLQRPVEPGQRLVFEANLASELLYAGRTQEAIDLFRQLQPLAARFHLKGNPSLDEFLAVAYLRQGEQENCLLNHTSASCLFPIGEAGRHQLPRGSRQALIEYTVLLQKNPDDLVSRWLLNIAYMTLGEYPDGVPPQWLIPPSAFASDYDIRPFPEIASSLGLDRVGRAGAAILEDFDGDGFLDLLTSSWTTDPLRYFHNEGNGHFAERTREALLQGLVGGLNMVQTDYNNDGHPDVLVLRGAWMGEQGCLPNSLLRNQGNGTFEDVTEEAGLLSFHPTQVGVWGDYDNDGWLDLFIGNESMPGPGERPHPCELYHNNQDGTFTNVARESGLAGVGVIKGATWTDVDNDDDPDLYLSLFDGPNLLFRNDGPDPAGGWNFTEVSRQAGVSLPERSFPTWSFDYDNDGWEDLFISGYRMVSGRPILQPVVADYLGLPTDSDRCHLYRNQGDGTYEDVSQQAGISKVIYTMGCNFGDLDNDGWLDFYLGTGNPDYRSLMPNRMFRNAGGQFFQDVTTSGGFGHLQKGHGVSFGDIDNDGDQDIYEVIGGAYSGDVYQSVLFENPEHHNHWITLKLEGVQSNRAGIGARIRVRVADPQGGRDIRVTAGTGSSFGANSLQQEIGLGQATTIEELEVRWPTSGTVQRFSGVAMDRFYQLREGRDQLVQLERRPIDLTPGGEQAAREAHAHHDHKID